MDQDVHRDSVNYTNVLYHHRPRCIGTFIPQVLEAMSWESGDGNIKGKGTGISNHKDLPTGQVEVNLLNRPGGGK